MTDYIALALEAGQLVEMDDVLDDDEDSPTFDTFVRTYQEGPNAEARA